MKLYRYEYNGEGVYQALKKAIGVEQFDQLIKSSAFNWLLSPQVYKDKRLKLEAWFTEEGNQLFIQHVLPLLPFVPEQKIIASGVPVYADKYQYILLKEESNGIRNNS